MRNEIKMNIKAAWNALNRGEVTKAEYENMVDAICCAMGTEVVAECFVEMTKAGEL